MDIDVPLSNEIVSLSSPFIACSLVFGFGNGSEKPSEVDPLGKMYYFSSPVAEGQARGEGSVTCMSGQRTRCEGNQSIGGTCTLSAFRYTAICFPSIVM